MVVDGKKTRSLVSEFISLGGWVGTPSRSWRRMMDDRMVPQRRAKKKNSVGPNDELTFMQSFVASRSWRSVMVAV